MVVGVKMVWRREIFGKKTIVEAMSMLTVPLGAALTLDSLFVEEKIELSEETGDANTETPPRKLPRWITFGMMTAMVLISMIVIQTDGRFPNQ